MSVRNVSLAAVTLLVLGLLAARAGRLENEAVTGGGGSSSDGLWVSGLNLVLLQGTPGVAYGMVEHPGQAKRFSYVILIKGDDGRRLRPSYSGETTINNRVATEKNKLRLDARQLEWTYRTEPGEGGKFVEAMTVGDKEIDLSKGRVLLVDISGKEPRWQQVPAALPPAPAYPTRVEGVQTLALDLLRKLRPDKAVTKFFE